MLMEETIKMENIHPMNETQTEEVTLTLLLYRLDKLEEEQRRENKEIKELLHTIQENQHHNEEKIIQFRTELTRVNARLEKLEKGKVDSKEFSTTCDNVNKRLDNFNKVIIGIVVSVGTLVITKLIEII